MAQYRVFDEETADLLSARLSRTDSIDLRDSSEYFSAGAGEVILAPSVKNGEVLYIRIRRSNTAPAVAPSAAPSAAPSTPVADVKPRHYVATGFLGLEGDLEEDQPAAPKPWWKRMFVD